MEVKNSNCYEEDIKKEDKKLSSRLYKECGIFPFLETNKMQTSKNGCFNFIAYGVLFSICDMRYRNICNKAIGRHFSTLFHEVKMMRFYNQKQTHFENYIFLHFLKVIFFTISTIFIFGGFEYFIWWVLFVK